jgi:hypothetical protein
MKRIGRFYKETVLSLLEDKRFEIKLPYGSGEIKIEKDLFGWKLYCGKKFVECRSEEEARYLKIFLEVGLSSVYVPKDEEYLKSILPELERLKKRTDEIINFHTSGILNKRIREEIRQKVYSEIVHGEIYEIEFEEPKSKTKKKNNSKSKRKSNSSTL